MLVDAWQYTGNKLSHTLILASHTYGSDFCNLVYHFVEASCEGTSSSWHLVVLAHHFTSLSAHSEKSPNTGTAGCAHPYICPAQTDNPSRWTVQFFIVPLSYQDFPCFEKFYRVLYAGKNSEQPSALVSPHKKYTMVFYHFVVFCIANSGTSYILNSSCDGPPYVGFPGRHVEACPVKQSLAIPLFK